MSSEWDLPLPAGLGFFVCEVEKLVRIASPPHSLSHWMKKKKSEWLCQGGEDGLEVKSYGPCWHKGVLERRRKKGSCVHQSTCAGAALCTNRIVADVAWIMSGGGAWNALPRGCLSLQGSDERERAGFFVYPGVPALLGTTKNCFWSSLSCGYFHFALENVLKLAWMLQGYQGKRSTLDQRNSFVNAGKRAEGNILWIGDCIERLNFHS